MKGIEFSMVDSNQNRDLQARIKYLNIDNNTTYDTHFPVILTPTKAKELLAPDTKNYFMDVHIHQKPFTKDVR